MTSAPDVDSRSGNARSRSLRPCVGIGQLRGDLSHVSNVDVVTGQAGCSIGLIGSRVSPTGLPSSPMSTIKLSLIASELLLTRSASSIWRVSVSGKVRFSWRRGHSRWGRL